MVETFSQVCPSMGKLIFYSAMCHIVLLINNPFVQTMLFVIDFLKKKQGIILFV